MPIHDWTSVDAGIFHDFDLSWIAEFQRALNSGLLPGGYDALAEQLTGKFGPDVPTLESRSIGRSPPSPNPRAASPWPMLLPGDHAPAGVGRAPVTCRPPSRPHEPDRQGPFAAFIHKAEQALLSGIHLLIVDLFLPTRRDPDGIHRVIWGGEGEGDFALRDDKPLTCVSYLGDPEMQVFLEPVAVGDLLPEMPLFLPRQTYVAVPLEATYNAAWESVPGFLRDELSAPPSVGRKRDV